MPRTWIDYLQSPTMLIGTVGSVAGVILLTAGIPHWLELLCKIVAAVTPVLLGYHVADDRDVQKLEPPARANPSL